MQENLAPLRRGFLLVRLATDIQVSDRLAADQNLLGAIVTVEQVDVIGPARPFLIDDRHDRSGVVAVMSTERTTCQAGAVVADRRHTATRIPMSFGDLNHALVSFCRPKSEG